MILTGTAVKSLTKDTIGKRKHLVCTKSSKYSPFGMY